MFHRFCSSIESKRVKRADVFVPGSMGTGRGRGVTLSASGSKSHLFYVPKPLQTDAEHQSPSDTLRVLSCTIRDEILPPRGRAR